MLRRELDQGRDKLPGSPQARMAVDGNTFGTDTNEWEKEISNITVSSIVPAANLVDLG